MRKWTCMVICMILILALAGCGKNSASGSPAIETAGESTGSAQEAAAPGASEEAPGGKIDVDLTILSSTMVYSEVYNMMSSPEDYVGKTVKMNGLFSCYHSEQTGNYYFACIIKDATQCCSQGIEFELTGNPSYPDDYPPVDSEICVVGVFDTYQEGEYTYCTLRNASFL